MPIQPSRALPARPDLDQQKKLAKELLAVFHNGDPESNRRIRRHLPDKPDITLADAQFVLAREYGFENWSALKAHIAEASGLEPVEQFRLAVEHGRIDDVRRVLMQHDAARDAINAPLFSFGGRAIHTARTPAMIDVLIEFGADVNLRSDWWAGPWHVLHGASGSLADHLLARGAEPDACAAASLDRIELLTRLLEENPARAGERGGDGQTPLHFARSREVIDLLLERGADIDARDVDHRGTAAEWMLDHRRGAGRFALAEYLVQRGAYADIFLAAALGRLDRIQELVLQDPAVLELRTTQGDYAEKPPSSFHIYMWTIGANLSPLQVAAQFQQDTAVAVLGALASPRQRFVAACALARSDEARALVARNPDLVSSLTPEEQRALPDAAWSGNARAVALMLELGFDPFTPGQDTGTVLHCAAWEGDVACTRAVLSHSAARQLVATRDATHGGTPLDWCCHGSIHCRHGNYPEVARLLLAAGAVPIVNYADVPREVRAVIEDASAGGHRRRTR